jgi:diguanylate cyclase (GGDEF)-like protein
MNLENNMIINLYSIIILLVVFLYARDNDNAKLLQNRVYLLMVKVTMVLLVFDIFSRFDGNINSFFPILNHTGNFFAFALSLVLPSLFLVYVHCQIYIKKERTKELILPLVAINLVNLFFTVLSEFFGVYFYIDQYNVYHRGFLFFLPAIFTIILIIITFVFIATNYEIFDQKRYYSLLFFVIPLLLGIILQLIFYGMSLMLNGVVISLLIVFFSIQNRNVLTDSLTGISNRKSLEEYLERKINSISKNKTFSAILIDIDGFKKINDNFGHNEGDKALQISSKLLSDCLRYNDFIARFGGDEFFIILDTSKSKDLDYIVHRIRENVANFNDTNVKKYKIEFSMGYAVYDYNLEMNIEEFQKHLDLLMHKDKESVATTSPI